ncbi:tetratricopeptide repeat protein [Kineosporia babensis]|uniref:XRE family transcriptional regulator n=1 Tax=Kineosporia babensis TaxID=499548 RepID=A0A9X1NML9_9ACTN|nr:XRE family transcriptional regulator [Kineosporia babensis]MCD5317160.1 XRE family transcriptional regulator [Kineosporia babensis]
MRLHSERELPDDSSLLRQWKRWEAGETIPGDFYQGLIASTFGTVTRALFPAPGHRNGAIEVADVAGMETLEIVSRLRRSDIDNATLDALRITVDRLCSEYAYLPADQLLIEGRNWLNRIASMQSQRLTLSQHREVLTLAGWLALLVGCVEYDLGDRRVSEATRKSALSLGQESDNTHVSGWAYEMRAWQALTTGDYRGVIAAARAGGEIAADQSVAVQLFGQEAKAWARIGDRRQTEVALDKGRKLLEGMEHPENLENHFVVDPAKFDFYAMDCYRILGEDPIAESLAHEVIRAGTDFDGTERSPMRIAEARITLGVAAARQGDLDSAVAHGQHALLGERKSLPSLLMVSRDLASVVNDRYASEPAGRDYLDSLKTLAGNA